MSLPKMFPESCGWRWDARMDLTGGAVGWVMGDADAKLSGMPLSMIENTKKLAFAYYKLKRMDAAGVPDGLLDAIEKQWRFVIEGKGYDVDVDYLQNMDTSKSFDWNAY